MKQRSTEIEIPMEDYIDEQTARASLRNKVQPWLDELNKDDVQWRNLTFFIEQSARSLTTKGVLVRVQVDVEEEETQ